MISLNRPAARSLPPLGADGEALEAPERRVAVPPATGSPPLRVPGGGRRRAVLSGAASAGVVEPLDGGRRRVVAAATARDQPAGQVPRRSRPAGRGDGHLRRAPCPGQDVRFLRISNSFSRRHEGLCEALVP